MIYLFCALILIFAVFVGVWLIAIVSGHNVEIILQLLSLLVVVTAAINLVGLMLD